MRTSYFIKYVVENNKYPTRDNYIKYMANKQLNREENAKDTLPQHINDTVVCSLSVLFLKISL